MLYIKKKWENIIANKSGKLKVSIKGKKVKAKILDESNECDGNACTTLPTVGIYNPGTQLCMYDGGKTAELFHFEKFLIPVLFFFFSCGLCDSKPC